MCSRQGWSKLNLKCQIVQDKNEQRDPTLRNSWSPGIRSIFQEISTQKYLHKRRQRVSQSFTKKKIFVSQKSGCHVTFPQVAEVANIMQNNVEKLLERWSSSSPLLSASASPSHYHHHHHRNHQGGKTTRDGISRWETWTRNRHLPSRSSHPSSHPQ